MHVKLIRLPAVLSRVPYSRPTIWRLEQEGKFPRRRKLSSNAVAWVESEIDAWIEEKVGQSPAIIGAAKQGVSAPLHPASKPRRRMKVKAV